ncbi:hypothetical protein G9A89_007646 [Geosiphon pyriformis]|nr:hypothetical protein G9A89_007646 [Geosiphon pyriformis]
MVAAYITTDNIFNSEQKENISREEKMRETNFIFVKEEIEKSTEEVVPAPERSLANVNQTTPNVLNGFEFNHNERISVFINNTEDIALAAAARRIPPNVTPSTNPNFSIETSHNFQVNDQSKSNSTSSMPTASPQTISPIVVIKRKGPGRPRKSEKLSFSQGTHTFSINSSPTEGTPDPNRPKRTYRKKRPKISPTESIDTLNTPSPSTTFITNNNNNNNNNYNHDNNNNNDNSNANNNNNNNNNHHHHHHHTHDGLNGVHPIPLAPFNRSVDKTFTISSDPTPTSMQFSDIKYEDSTITNSSRPVKRGPGRPRKLPVSIDNSQNSISEATTPINVSSPQQNDKKRNADGDLKNEHSLDTSNGHVVSKPSIKKFTPRKRPKTFSPNKLESSSSTSPIVEKKSTPLDEVRNAHLKEKELCLAKVVDDHDSLVRELYYMENFNLLVWDLDRHKLKQDNSERMVKYLESHNLWSTVSDQVLNSVQANSTRMSTRRSLNQHRDSLVSILQKTFTSHGLNLAEAPTLAPRSRGRNRRIEPETSPPPTNNPSINILRRSRGQAQFPSVDVFLASFVTLDDEDMTPMDAQARAIREADIQYRIYSLRKQGRILRKTPKPQIEPRRPLTHKDHLLDHITSQAKYMTKITENKNKITRQINKAVLQHFNKLANQDEKDKKAEEKRLKRLAKTTANLIRQKWKTVESIILAKQKEIMRERQERKGKRHLNLLLEHSTQMLEVQQNELLGTPITAISSYGIPSVMQDPSSKELDFIEFEHPDEDGAKSISEIGDNDSSDDEEVVKKLQAEKDLPLKELLEKYDYNIGDDDDDLGNRGWDDEDEFEKYTDPDLSQHEQSEDEANQSNAREDTIKVEEICDNRDRPSENFIFSLPKIPKTEETNNIANSDFLRLRKRKASASLSADEDEEDPDENDYEFKIAPNDQVEDDEASLDAQEREENPDEEKVELNGLKDESNLPIEDLIKRYYGYKIGDEMEEGNEVDDELMIEEKHSPIEYPVIDGEDIPNREQNCSSKDFSYISSGLNQVSSMEVETENLNLGLMSPQNNGSETDVEEYATRLLVEESSSQREAKWKNQSEESKTVQDQENYKLHPTLRLRMSNEQDQGSSRKNYLNEQTLKEKHESDYETSEKQDDDQTNEGTKEKGGEEEMEDNKSTNSEKHRSPALVADPPTGTTLSTATVRTQIPSLLRGQLREYQHVGLDWLASLYNHGLNGILADEMGLGKTIQTIALLAHLAWDKGVWGPHLIVVPTSVIINWEMEFKKWCPGFSILTYYGSPRERKEKRMGWSKEHKFNVCITSYQLVVQDQNVFRKKRWHYLILDEAHNIKNFRSQRWQTLLNFNSTRRLLLTGTPLQNNLMELWSLLYFLMPQGVSQAMPIGFANQKEFQEWFSHPVDKMIENNEQMDDETRAAVSKLHTVLRPYLLRRLKVDVEKQLPGKYEHIIYCRLSKRQRFLYDDFMSRAKTKETLQSGNFLSIINCLMQLRKVCNHPDLFEVRPIRTSFAMSRSAIADYEIKELLIRRNLFQERDDEVNMDFLNLVPRQFEGVLDWLVANEWGHINPEYHFWHQIDCLGMVQKGDLKNGLTSINYKNVALFNQAMKQRNRLSLRQCWDQMRYINSFRLKRRPIYGTGLIKLCRELGTTICDNFLADALNPRKFWQRVDCMTDLVVTNEKRYAMMEEVIKRYAFVTPAVVAKDISSIALVGMPEELRWMIQTQVQDLYHPIRVKLQIAFPDKRLLQFDCGKLQKLDELLRSLKTGGHRALIFTQMTRVLDILEIFLNIHGHRYLRLDGATKIEQRQLLTERFNHDPKILVFILSTRSGGLGINLTGADTVIFYDSDWNPCMDRQCQDRCHRIGQTRDVHIYRFVSEYSIEENMLRKANQKRMLDDLVITEGEFTTDYFHKLDWRDLLNDIAPDRAKKVHEEPISGMELEHCLAQVEDDPDVNAARMARTEMDLDLTEFAEPTSPVEENSSAPPSSLTRRVSDLSSINSPPEVMDDTKFDHVDNYMLRLMEREMGVYVGFGGLPIPNNIDEENSFLGNE